MCTHFSSLSLLDQNKPHDQAQIQCGRRLPRGDVYKLWAVILTTWPKQHSYIVLSSWMNPSVAPFLERFQKKVLTHTVPFCPKLNKASFSHYVSLSGLDSKGSDWKAGVWSELRSDQIRSELWSEPQVWSLGQEDPLEKGIVTHSSILAWRIPWSEEPGRLQSKELQRVRHDWMTNTFFQIPWH